MNKTNRKKQIKDQVNENWFYINFVADHLTHSDAVKKVSSVKQDSIVFDSKEEIPEWDNIVVMSWILSQNYPVGKKSRNGYKIVQTGVDYSDYKYNNIVLLQHNDSFGGIGRTRMVYLDNKWNSNIIMYVDLNTISDEAVRYQIKNWYMKWVSTGHSLLESMFEDIEDKGNLLTFEDAEDKYGYYEVLMSYFGSSDKLIYTVTKALMIENSVVTIGSNEKAILTHDTIGNFAIKDLMNSDRLKSNLLNDKDDMKKSNLIKLIEDSVLTKKEQKKFIDMLNAMEEESEEVAEVEKEVNEAIEGAEEAEERVEEKVEEEIEEEEEVEEEKEAEEDEKVEEEKEEVEEVEEKVEDSMKKEEEEVEEEEKEEEKEEEEEASDEEEEEELEDKEDEEVVDSINNEDESREDNKEVPRDTYPEPEEHIKLSNSIEKHTDEISTLKNELKAMSDKVSEMSKLNDELTEVVKSLSELTLKNSKNLSNIVTLWVNEVQKPKVDSGLNSLKKVLESAR